MRERFQLEYTIAWLVDIMYEGLRNVERTQQGIESGVMSGIVLSESGVSTRHSVQQAEKWVNAASVEDALR